MTLDIRFPFDGRGTRQKRVDHGVAGRIDRSCVNPAARFAFVQGETQAALMQPTPPSRHVARACGAVLHRIEGGSGRKGFRQRAGNKKMCSRHDSLFAFQMSF
ncbi:MAG: hypothetical protein EPN73_06265 [Paraburkholderia sp.]|nr:MAG: hypothetical protein EPN73_06265 [Paraburkholderia sp.]